MVYELVPNEDRYDRCKWFHKLNPQYQNNYEEFCIRYKTVYSYQNVKKVFPILVPLFTIIPYN